MMTKTHRQHVSTGEVHPGPTSNPSRYHVSGGVRPPFRGGALGGFGRAVGLRVQVAARCVAGIATISRSRRPLVEVGRRPTRPGKVAGRGAADMRGASTATYQPKALRIHAFREAVMAFDTWASGFITSNPWKPPANTWSSAWTPCAQS